MARQDTLIAIEGIDGSGKRTQIEMLSRGLKQRRVRHVRISFPRYESSFGSMVGRFLNGEFGPLEQVNPYFSALLFASDRLEAKPELERAFRSGAAVIADRYIASNLAHQGARVSRELRDGFLAWLKHVEYRIFGLPVEDLVIYLRLPASVAQELVEKKAARGYTQLQKDIQEANLAHLQQAAQVYDRLARARNWVTVECYDASSRRIRAPEEIHAEVMRAIAKRLPGLFRARRGGKKARRHRRK
jgi:dTMP kinase